MEQQNPSGKPELLASLYRVLAQYPLVVLRPIMDTDGRNDTLPHAEPKRVSVQVAEEMVGTLSTVIDKSNPKGQCCDYVDGDAIFYSRINGAVYCKRNVGNGEHALQQSYERTNLPYDFRLHVFLAERKRTHIESSIDMIVSLTDKNGVPICTESFDYTTTNRLLFDPLVYQTSRRLKRELTSYLLSHKTISAEESSRIAANTVLSLTSMSSNLLKSLRIGFEHSRINKPA